MKITKAQLKQIIKEELETIKEVDATDVNDEILQLVQKAKMFLHENKVEEVIAALNQIEKIVDPMGSPF